MDLFLLLALKENVTRKLARFGQVLKLWVQGHYHIITLSYDNVNIDLDHVLRHDRYSLLQIIMMGKFYEKRRSGRRKKIVVTYGINRTQLESQAWNNSLIL